jgi:hypothetical protein
MIDLSSLFSVCFFPLQSFAAGAAHGVIPSHETDYWIQHVQWGVVAGLLF